MRKLVYKEALTHPIQVKQNTKGLMENIIDLIFSTWGLDYNEGENNSDGEYIFVKRPRRGNQMSMTLYWLRFISITLANFAIHLGLLNYI